MLLNLGYIALLSCGFGDTLQNVPVDTVYIHAQRIELSQIGRVKLDINASSSPQSMQNSLLNSAVFLKQYGVSGSSTISRRGADPAQTQVLWNGLPVNNPMHGLTDFNNISSFGLQEVFIIEGGNSALFGSGSVGGTIFLRNKIKFNQGVSAQYISQYGQYQNFANGVNAVIANKTHYLQLTASRINNNNRFPFFDQIEGLKRTSENAFLNQQLYRAVYGFKKLAHELKLVVENNEGNRGLGTQLGSAQYLGIQKDNNFRSVIEYQYSSNDFQSVMRLGYVRDIIKYYSDGIHGDSSVAHTPYFQTEFYKTWKGVRWLFGMDAQQINAYSLNYKILNANRFYSASFVSGTFKIWKSDITINSRFEHLEKIPTAGISMVTPLKTFAKLKFNIHTSFRRQTLNDLFWNTNATKLAVPEKGWGTEIGFQKELNLPKQQYSVEITAYYRELNNPIIWVPNGASWIATNFYSGKYLGAQMQSKYMFNLLETKVKIFAIADWVRTQVKNTSESMAHQQIFIPDFMGNVGFTHLVKKGLWGFDIQHVGNRYIQTDNQQWLAGYRLVNAQVGVSQIPLKRLKNESVIKLNMLLECKNLFNVIYQSMPNRVMPGRTFWLSLSINI